MCLCFLSHEPDRACPHSLCPQGQGSRTLATAGNSTCSYHRRGSDRVNDLWNQHHSSNLASMATSFKPLRDNKIDSRCLLLQRMLHRPDQGTDAHVTMMCSCNERCRGNAEGT